MRTADATGRSGCSGRLPAVLIRPATPDDAVEIAAVHLASMQRVYRGVLPDEVLDGPDLAANRLRLWQHWLSEPPAGGSTVVAERPGGRIVGLAHTAPARDDDVGDGVGELQIIYVDPVAWGTGAGRALMAAAVDGLREAGWTTAILWVLDRNARARRFYERARWAPDGAEKDDVLAGTPIREVRYRRAL
jgi:GNAT superfamily N-acetyltransferase